MLTYPKYLKLLPQRPEGYQNQAEWQEHLQMYKKKKNKSWFLGRRSYMNNCSNMSE